MRLFSSALLLAPVALAKSYHAAQQPIQVYLHPTPSSQHHAAAAAAAPTLTAEQANAVLAHHLGQDMSDFEELPQDEDMWSHLMGMWNGHVRLEGHKAKVVIVQGGVEAQDVLPSSLSQTPSFYMEENHGVKALLAPYNQQAELFLSQLLEILPESFRQLLDMFDTAGSKAATALGQELSCLTAMADNVPWLHDLKSKVSFDAISISSLGQVDRYSEEWETGRASVQAGLAAMTTPDSPPLLLVIMPSSASSGSHYAARSVAEPPMLSSTAAKNTTAGRDGCYATNETCSDSTSCNGRGSCALLSKKGDKECWGCKCASGFAGAECQKTDYSVPFVILVFSTVLLVGILVGSVMLLFSVGETKLPSTLTLAVGPSKRD